MTTPLRAVGLGKRYRRTWALRDCSLALPEGRVVALVGPRRDPPTAGPHQVVAASHTDRQTTLLVRTAGPVHDPAWAVHPVGLEQLVLAYMRHPETTAMPRPALAAVPHRSTKEVSA